MSSVGQQQRPAIAPIDQQPAREAPDIRPIDEQVGGTAATAEILPIDQVVEATPNLEAAEREAALAEANGPDSPMARREEDLALAREFSPTIERELRLAVARAWTPTDEREVALLRAQASADYEDPDVALLLETRADFMEREGQERLTEAEAALEDYLERQEAAGLH